MRILPVIVVAAASAFAFSQITPDTGDWPVYGHDPAGTRPIYGVEERPVPKGDIAGEWYSPTEPFPLKPPPLSRMTMTMDDVSKRTPEAEKFCGEWFSRLRSQGAYTPFGSTASLSMPGTMGGGNWGGVSFDPDLGYIFVNTSSLGTVGQMAPTVTGQLCPIATWAVTLVLLTRRDTRANSRPGANSSR
jgi:glucose dehydrogenase